MPFACVEVGEGEGEGEARGTGCCGPESRKEKLFIVQSLRIGRTKLKPLGA